MIGIGTTFRSDDGAAAGANALISTWYDALSVKPSAGLLSALNDLSSSLNDDGIWTELDLFHVIGGLETDEQRLKPLISSSGNDFTNVNSATLGAGGVTGDGATSYLDLNWNPSTDGVKYLQDDASLGVYSRTDNFNTNCDLGVYQSSGALFTQWYVRYTSSTSLYRANTSAIETDLSADALGLYLWQRDGASSVEAFKNGVSTGTSSSSSKAVPNLDLFLCALNIDGSPGQFQTREQAMVVAGSSSFNQSDFFNAIDTFMTTRGINV